MPVTHKGVQRFLEAGIGYGSGKAAHAGGVTTSFSAATQPSSRSEAGRV